MKKKIRVLVAALVWWSIGVFNFGAINADLEWERIHENAILHQSWRDHLGIVVVESCLVPPLQIFSVLCITNFLEHGWYLGESKGGK